MFSKAIVQNDVFLDMPLSSQGLYFHLCMNADDYGFVSPKFVMRTIGANDDDLKLLILKRYVLAFESGVVVIKHWQVNNTIRKDRSHDTTYQKEFLSLTLNEFGAYSEIAKISEFVQLTTEQVQELQQPSGVESTGLPNGNQTSPEIRIDKIRIEENRLDKTRLDKDNGVAKEATPRVDSKRLDSLFGYWAEQVGYPVTAKLKQNREYAGKLLKEYSSGEIAMMIKAAAMASEDQYAPGVSNFIDLYRKWDGLKLWGKKKGVRSVAAQF